MVTDMDYKGRIDQLERLLANAMELLDDNKRMLAMFDKGYYFKLKGIVDDYHIKPNGDTNNQEYGIN
ncbi:hypothetical protein ABIB62_004422 [Mucilaginibacter sp. UYP25]|uniref:hypothetical protein n=1 Tax=unclassified Mucilaginibacter TaxID=2617802 RepID=UPI003394A27D